MQFIEGKGKESSDMNVEETLKRIRPVSESWTAKARERLDSLTKPRGSLGVMEDLAARFAAIRQQIPVVIPSKEVVVFAGDHDVVSEGVSAYPQEVTKLMVQNFLQGGAGINVLARCAGAEISIVDIGMKEAIPDAPALIAHNVRRGAGNILRGPAMTLEEAEKAVSIGIDMAESAAKRGTGIIATGEMGIGNTTPSSALFASLLSLPVREVTGRGTGLDEEGLIHKIGIIEKALEVNRDRLKDPMSTLAAIGGLEIAGICGLCLGGAANQMAVVVDGFISSAGAMVAMRLNPDVRDYLFFSHQSVEVGHRVFYEREGIRPILNLDLRLGEGTGAALAMQVIECALRVFNEMATFEDVGIEPGA